MSVKRFIAITATGHARQSQALARMDRARPDWASVVACLEKVKGEKWEEFRDRHGDSGRNLALYLGRREGGPTLAELAKVAGLKGVRAIRVSSCYQLLPTFRDVVIIQ